MSRWPIAVPGVAAMLLAVALALTMGELLATACAVLLLGSVVAAVRHAEVVAHRVGEPFGTLVLALSITVIELACGHGDEFFDEDAPVCPAYGERRWLRPKECRAQPCQGRSQPGEAHP